METGYLIACALCGDMAEAMAIGRVLWRGKSSESMSLNL